MRTTDNALAKEMKLADAYADACFTQGLNQCTDDPLPEKAREALAELLITKNSMILKMMDAIEAIEDAMTVGDRWSNAGQALLDANAAARDYLKGSNP